MALSPEEEVLGRSLLTTLRAARAKSCAYVRFTTGGAELAATEHAIKAYGRELGFELGDAYARENQERSSLEPILRISRNYVDLEPGVPDSKAWSRIRATVDGATCVIAFSMPAFDANRTIALVRTDLFLEGGTATTRFFHVTRQPDDSWRVGSGITGLYEHLHDDDAHIHRPDDHAYYHDRDR